MSRELNLLPQSYNESEVVKKKKKNIILGVTGGIILVGLGVGYTFGREVYLEYEKNRLQEEINRNREMVNKDKSLSNEIALTKAHIKKAKELESLKSKSTDKLLKDFSKQFPQGVVIENLSYSKDKITATGSASSKDEVEVFWANLRESETFTKSYITSIADSNGRVSFNLDITLGGEKINGEN